jgi:hypothetical protein
MLSGYDMRPLEDATSPQFNRLISSTTGNRNRVAPRVGTYGQSYFTE